MIDNFQNSPVIYVTVKLIFNNSIGNYGTKKYQTHLYNLSPLGFISYTTSDITGLEVKQFDNQVTVSNANIQRLAYFSSNRNKCAIIGDNYIELRLTEYDNYNDIFNTFEKLVQNCFEEDIAINNKLREIELHYVDLFTPQNDKELKNMFSTKVFFPNSQFYTDGEEIMQIGMTSLTRILGSGKSKVSVSLEHIKAKGKRIEKWLPDVLIEPDTNLAMPLNINKLGALANFDEHVIVHTACGTLFNTENKLGVDTQEMLSDIRTKLTEQYKETKKTFNFMIADSISSKAAKN